MADREIWVREETERRKLKYEKDQDQYTLDLTKFNTQREKKGDNQFVGAEDYVKILDAALEEQNPGNRCDLLNDIVVQARKRRREAIDVDAEIDVTLPPPKKHVSLRFENLNPDTALGKLKC